MSRKAHKENALKDDKQFGFTKRWSNAKTQRKTHAKFAQLYFEPFAFPFVPFAMTSSLGSQKGGPTQRRKGKNRKVRPVIL
jgi:hypothetical protein